MSKRIKYPEGVNKTNFVSKLRSAGGDGGAVYCWGLCVAAAEVICQLEKQLSLNTTPRAKPKPTLISFRKLWMRGYIKFTEDEAANYRLTVRGLLEDCGVPEDWAFLIADQCNAYNNRWVQLAQKYPADIDSKAELVSDILRHAFTWSRTPEGSKFWHSAVQVIEYELFDEDVQLD